MTDHLVDNITGILLTVTLAVVILYMLIYHVTARWEDSSIGRALMFKSGAWAALIIAVLMPYWFGTSLVTKSLLLVVSFISLLAQTRMLYVMINQQIRVSMETKATIAEDTRKDEQLGEESNE